MLRQSFTLRCSFFLLNSDSSTLPYSQLKIRCHFLLPQIKFQNVEKLKHQKTAPSRIEQSYCKIFTDLRNATQYCTRREHHFTTPSFIYYCIPRPIFISAFPNNWNDRNRALLFLRSMLH